MVYPIALLIFLGLSAARWVVSVALYQHTTDGPDPPPPRTT